MIFKNRKNKASMLVETMIAISILGITMTYVGYDARFLSRTLYQLNEMDKMLYAYQEAIEKYKLDFTGGTLGFNGYTVDITSTSDPAQDPNLTQYLEKVIVTVHPKDSSSGLGDLVMVSYVYLSNKKLPEAPKNLTAVPVVNGIKLTWDSSTYADSYNVKRSTTLGGPYTVIATGITETYYTDTTVTEGVTYYYVVSATNAYGEGPNSNEAFATYTVKVSTLNPVADAYVRGGFYANRNYGGVGYLYFRNASSSSFKYKSYLKFDISSVKGSIVSAKLRLYGYSSGVSQLSANIHQLADDSWTELGITWNTAPLEGSVISSTIFTFVRKYVEIDVTNYCSNELLGNKVASFVITTSSTRLGVANSREALANKPELVIKWVPAPPPSPPQNLKAVPGDKQVSLSWNLVTGAVSYNVKRSTTSGGPYTTIKTDVTATNYIDTGLTNGTTYYYVVSAVNENGESGNSNEASATPNKVVTVIYNPVADSYVRDGDYKDVNYGDMAKLEVNNGSSGTGAIRISYIKFDLSNLRGDIISAKLRLYGGNIEDSSNVTIGYYEIVDNTWQENTITFSNAPVKGREIASLIINNTQTYWEVDITDYVRTKVAGDKIINLAIAGKDVARLVSFNSKENLVNKPELVITKTLLKPLPPSNLTATPDNRLVTLKWIGSDETDYYNVKRSTIDGGPYTTIATGVTSTSFNDSSVANGTTYYYVVTAVNASGESSNSNQASATPNTTITVTLNPVADARVESYYPNTNYGSETSLEVIRNGVNDKKSYLRFDLKGYTNNTVVSATLRLYGKSNVSSFKINGYAVSNNNWIESGTGGITWNNAPVLETQIATVNIGTVSQYYDMDVSSYVAAAINTSNLVSIGLFTDVNSSNNAVINSKETSTNKPQLVVKMVEGIPKPPTNLVALGGNRLVDLSWKPSDGAVSYNVKRSNESGGPYTTIASGIVNTAYRDLSVKNGNIYYYVVTAVNAKGESGNSNETCGIPNAGASSQTLLAVEDAYVKNGIYSDANYGGEASINVSKSSVSNDGNTQYGYIKFDLSNVTGNVSSGTLIITGENITGQANRDIIINIYKVIDDSWGEYTITWNNAPGSDVLLGSIVVNKKYATKSLDITDYVRSELAGDKKLSLCLKAVTTDLTASFSSIQGTDPPLLQITY